MKVLNDNYTKNPNVRNNPIIAPYPRKLMCECCNSILEYEESDLRVGTFGNVFLDCPLCGKDNMPDDNEHSIELTADNVEFPTHFWHTSKETGAVNCCNNATVKADIHRAIKFFRENKNESYWFTTHGNLYIAVYREDVDKDYWVVVSNDFHETYLTFESADYAN